MQWPLFSHQTGGGDDDLDTMSLKNSIKQSIARQQYETFAALTFAAKAGDVEVVRDLIRRGANINAVDYDGRSAFAMVRLRSTSISIFLWLFPIPWSIS